MTAFSVGQRVKINPEPQDGYGQHVLKYLGPEACGIVHYIKSAYGHFQVFVDWERDGPGFHRGTNPELRDYIISTKTGFWLDPRSVLPAGEPYDPNQEPEDDCL